MPDKDIGGTEIYDIYIEDNFECCLTQCPFDDCTPARSESPICPRNIIWLKHLRAEGLLPEGYLTGGEAAAAVGLNPQYFPSWAVEHQIPSIMHRSGQRRWRLYLKSDIDAFLVQREHDESGDAC